MFAETLNVIDGQISRDKTASNTMFNTLAKYMLRIRTQSGIVIRFDNHVTSQHGGHFKNREFSYSLHFARYLFDYTRVIYP